MVTVMIYWTHMLKVRHMALLLARCVYKTLSTKTTRVARCSQGVRGILRALIPGCSLIHGILSSLGLWQHTYKGLFVLRELFLLSLFFSLFLFELTSKCWCTPGWSLLVSPLFSFPERSHRSYGIRYDLYHIFVDDPCISQDSIREPGPVVS